MEEKKRVVQLHIESSPIITSKARDILNSVIGQLSDGIWENANRCTGYWQAADVDRDGNLLLDISRYCDYSRFYGHYVRNPYHYMKDVDVLKYFARKIKEIALIELKDTYESEIYTKFLGKNYRSMFEGTPEEYREFRKKELEASTYLNEHPFVARGKFCPNESIPMDYLDYDAGVTLADAYSLYQHLHSVIKSLEKEEKDKIVFV